MVPAESALAARPRGRTGLRPRKGTQGTVSYEMSYPTRKTLQYGETHAQESERLTSTFFVCQMSIILNKTGDSRGEATACAASLALAAVLTGGNLHLKCFPCRLQRRHISFRLGFDR